VCGVPIWYICLWNGQCCVCDVRPGDISATHRSIGPAGVFSMSWWELQHGGGADVLHFMRCRFVLPELIEWSFTMSGRYVWDGNGTECFIGMHLV
jgi:hypothetical protein